MAITNWKCIDCAMGEEHPCALNCLEEDGNVPTQCPIVNDTECAWVKNDEPNPQQLLAISRIFSRMKEDIEQSRKGKRPFTVSLLETYLREYNKITGVNNA